MTDLSREFIADICRLTWAVAAEFDPWLGVIMCRQGIGFDVVDVDDQTRAWSRVEPGNPGVPALILPARMHQDDPPHDLVAVTPETYRAYCRTGYAVALGEHAMEAETSHLPVTMSPMTWLHSGGQGAYPIDLPRFADWCLRHPEIRLTVPSAHERERLLLALETARGRLPAIDIITHTAGRSS
jgi:hypothetical protein